MSGADSVTDYEDETFRSQFIPVFLLIALFAGILAFGALLLTGGSDLDMIGVAVVGGVLVIGGTIWARRLIAAYPVHVGPGGLRAYGLRGRPSIDAHWLAWPAIMRVSRFSFPFVPCLVIRTRISKRRYWIPLNLVNAARFRGLVNEYAGRAHPLTRALFG